MEKKIGQIIEERLRAQNVNVTEFAKRLHTRRENVYSIFKRENIDIELLKKIGHLLNYDFFQDLLEPSTVHEIVLRNSMTNKVYVELDLTPEEVKSLGIEDKVLTKLKE